MRISKLAKPFTLLDILVPAMGQTLGVEYRTMVGNASRPEGFGSRLLASAAYPTQGRGEALNRSGDGFFMGYSPWSRSGLIGIACRRSVNPVKRLNLKGYSG